MWRPVADANVVFLACGAQLLMLIILLLACGFVSPGANYTKTEQTQSTIMKKQSIIIKYAAQLWENNGTTHHLI
jgi:hypothetical protein